MGRHVRWLADRIERFVGTYWDTDVREDFPASDARQYLRIDGTTDAVRRFLLDVILHDAVGPVEWARLCNVHVRTPAEVRDDATDLWEWLFDGEPLPGSRGPRGPLAPPQA